MYARQGRERDSERDDKRPENDENPVISRISINRAARLDRHERTGRACHPSVERTVGHQREM
jgi:hypothetical protein